MQTIKTNLTRENEFVRDSMVSLTNQFKRYENYSNIMMSIKKEISSLSLQLLQRDKAQVREQDNYRGVTEYLSFTQPLLLLLLSGVLICIIAIDVVACIGSFSLISHRDQP